MSEPRSLDPEYTVSPRVLASNLVVMGSVPPIVPQEQGDEFVAHHGEKYALAFFSELAKLDRYVKGYTV